ncbi:helix-turn-helix domain-containing protein [Pseudoalteromonas spongiae]|uniref:Helix-turn-helix domain-containing protein n=1 Tax=Pseudoalteromonas spongiae TaxID=298657 RepID=A0ABU8EX60_9GAMM
MTLGEKLKQLRQEKGLSQPELAAEAGIEQSYLSKLENDKSLPSNDILRKILAAFQVSLSDFVTDELVQKDMSRLKQIPDVEQLIAQKSQNQFTQRRNFLLAASISIVLAATLFFIGYSKLIFNEYVYHYESIGVVKDDEPADIFSRWERYYFNTGEELPVLQRQKKHKSLSLEMAKRRVTLVQMTPEYKGPSYTETVAGGRRIYKLDNLMSKKIRRPINSWLQVLGVLLFASGIMGFVLERRLFKLN